MFRQIQWVVFGWVSMFVLFVVMPARAEATVASCGAGDAPSSHEAESCSSVCTESGSELLCDIAVLCGSNGSTAFAVTGFGSSTHNVSAWGTCNVTSAEFCCVFDEAAAIDTVTLAGTSSDDDLSFHLGADDLEPWDDDPIDGYMQGKGGNDNLVGSDYAPTDYNDHLSGGDGNDLVHGLDGGDEIRGGDGNDILYGEGGNDTIWGGDGDDTMYGDGGSDKMCDASGYDECASDGGNFFDGGTGDDKIWYEESEDPNVPCPGILMDLSSTAAGGSDQCGDNSNFDSSELPTSCETLITVRPTLCDGAN